MGNEAARHACWLYRFEEQILQCGVITHHADSSARNKPVAQRRIPDGEKDDLDSTSPVFSGHWIGSDKSAPWSALAFSC
jgi:hypothetical protein